MAKQLHVKLDKCTGCRNCELVCSWNRGKNFNPDNSAVSVVDYEEGFISVPMMCLQCEEAPCIKACNVESLSRDANGTVKIDLEKCVGCKLCIDVCPQRSMYFNEASKKVFKCELCNGDPVCVKHCPPGCLAYTDKKEEGFGWEKAITLTHKRVAKEAAK